MSVSPSMYRSVLKASSLIGGASAVNILVGMVRTKFVAVLLGPSGVGLIGVYGAITAMVGTVAGMGLSTSGVKHLAEAHGIGDAEALARTAVSLRRTVWLAGVLGATTMVLASWPLSVTSFGTGSEAKNIAALSVVVLLGAVSAGQTCLLQGTRHILELAWVSVLGSLSGTLLSVPCYYFWGQRGIVPSLVLSAIAGVLTSWFLARRVSLLSVRHSWRSSWTEATRLLRFGLPIMLSGLVASLGTYLIRVVLTRKVGLDGVGVYQAAFGLSGVLVNFVLGAMGTDYYPRLTAVVADPERTRQEINAQTEIALLLATPGLALTLLFAPVVVAIFYSGRFDAAVEILRWFVFGIYGRVVSWPLGYLILAKGKGSLFLLSESLATVLHLVLIWLCLNLWGLEGTGVAFALLYFVYTVFIYGLCRFLKQQLWTLCSAAHIMGFGVMLVLVGLLAAWVEAAWLRFSSGLIMTAVMSVYCLWRLSTRTGLTFEALRKRVVR